jgi:hypothetical protein
MHWHENQEKAKRYQTSAAEGWILKLTRGVSVSNGKVWTAGRDVQELHRFANAFQLVEELE